MDKRNQRLGAFLFGIIFVICLLALAVFFPTPTPFQYMVFKTVLSLAAAGVAAMIPGFLQVNVSGWIRAGGALAVFVIAYFYNPASLVVTPSSPGVSKTQIVAPIPKADSRLEFVEYSVTYPKDGSGLIVPLLDLKLRNIGGQVAYVKAAEIKVLDSATFEDCRNPEYSLVDASASYDIDLSSDPQKSISHAIKPADVDRIQFRVSRSQGGPTLTVYKVILRLIYDEDNKVTESKPFLMKMNGPATPAGLMVHGTSKAASDACVQRNIENFKRIGFRIYKDEPDCEGCSDGS